MMRIGRRRQAAPDQAPPPPPPASAAGPPPAAPGQTAAPGAAESAGPNPVTAVRRPPAAAAPGTAPPTASAAARPGTMPPRPTLEGLRAWLATLDRKVGLRTYLGIAAIVLALATSAVAIVLAIDARDNSADNDDLNAISERVNALESGSTADFDAAAFEARLTAIEDQLSGSGADAAGGKTAERLDVLESDIEELRDQIAELESGNP